MLFCGSNIDPNIPADHMIIWYGMVVYWYDIYIIQIIVEIIHDHMTIRYGIPYMVHMMVWYMMVYDMMVW